MPIDVAGEMQAAWDELSSQTETPQVSDVTETTEPQNTESQPPADNSNTSTQSTTGSDQDVKGPIPLERHKAILDPLRKEAEELRAKYDKLKSFEQVDPADFENYKSAMELARTNPVEYLRRMEAAFRQNPQYAHLFQSQPQQTTQQPPQDPRPLPDVLLEDGSKVYSDAQMDKLLEWRDRQAEQKRQAERVAEAELHTRSRDNAVAQFSDFQSKPGFTENMKEIADLMESDGRVTLDSAYNRIVVPKLLKAQEDLEKTARADERKKVLDELRNKAPAGDTAKPSGSQTTEPKSYKGMSTADIMADVARELSGQ
jgi:hypothetical protein